MDNHSPEQMERHLAALQPHGAPSALRTAVLAATHRELRAARWDRRLARVAMLLFLVGLGLNVAIGLRPVSVSKRQTPIVAGSSSQQQLVDTAIVIAEVTDAATGSRFARQLAAMSGHELTRDEAAAIDAAIEGAGKHGTNGNRG